MTLKDNTLRQTIRLSIGGKYFRFHFSNIFGENKLKIKSAHVAKADGQGSGKIKIDTDTIITFNGKEKITLYPKEEVTSDLIKFDASALSEITITLYFGSVPSILTSHYDSRTTTFIEKGNQVSKETFDSIYTLSSWLFLSAIDVLTNSNSKSIVCLGDDLTDGYGSTENIQNRWTDILATRLQSKSSTKLIGVLNHGMSVKTAVKCNKFKGECFEDSKVPTGEGRFDKDVVSQTNVKYLIVLYGINDIIYMDSDSVKIIESYKNIISSAHDEGITVYGGTLLPFGKLSTFNKRRETIRKDVNNWILNTSPENGGFDAVIDFSSIMADPTNNENLNPEFNFENDGIHPNDLGYEAMANAIDLSLFTKTSKLITEDNENKNIIVIPGYYLNTDNKDKNKKPLVYCKTYEPSTCKKMKAKANSSYSNAADDNTIIYCSEKTKCIIQRKN